MDNPPFRILVADDDDTMRLVLQLTLDHDDRFELVGCAADGVEALDLIAVHDPDVLLLDMEMPRCNGLEVLATLEGRARPTVVVLSAVGTAATITQALAYGAVAFLDKSTAAGDLGGAVAEALHGAGMGEA